MKSVIYHQYTIYQDGRVFDEKSKKFLNTFTLQNGSIIIDLIIDGKSRRKHLNKLLYGLFHRIKLLKSDFVIHIDGNKSNLDIDNLKHLKKEEYHYYRAMQNFKVGDFIHNEILYKDIPKLIFYKINDTGDVISFISGEPKIIKQRFLNGTPIATIKQYTKHGVSAGPATLYIARAVFHTFKGKKPKAIIYLDDDKTNCSLENLKEVTTSKRMKLEFDKGIRDKDKFWETRRRKYGASGVSKERKKRIILSKEQLTDIERLLKQGKPTKYIAEKHNLSYSYIYNNFKKKDSL